MPQPNSFFQKAEQSFDNASNFALPGAGQLNTASNRLQSRLAAQQKGNQRQIQNLFGGRGRSGAGQFTAATVQNQNNAANQLATGVAELESDFADKQQQGAQILSQVGSGQASAGAALSESDLAQQGLGIRQQEADIAGQKVTGELAQGEEALRISELQTLIEQALGEGRLELDETLGLGGLGEQAASRELQERLGFGQLEEQALARELDEILGLGELDVTRDLGEGELAVAREKNRLTNLQRLLDESLGTGRLDLEGEALTESIRQNKAQELVDFFNTFIEGGNLSADGDGRGPQFDRDFQAILDSIFDTIGTSPISGR